MKKVTRGLYLAAHAQVNPRTSRKEGMPIQVLLVDDDRFSRSVLQQIVASEPDHEVTVAEDGKQAWELLGDRTRTFDLVFLDLTMPVMDGFELLQHIRENPVLGTTEVIVVTGSRATPAFRRAMALGIKDYLLKPVPPGRLVAKLRQWREARQARGAAGALSDKASG